VEPGVRRGLCFESADVKHLVLAAGKFPREVEVAAFRHDHPGPALLEHGAQARGGERAVERHLELPGLQHAE
jgi:hypothetical protein